MGDTPGPIHKKRHKVLKWCSKSVFRRRSKDEDTHSTTPEPTTSTIATNPDATNGSVDPKIESPKIGNSKANNPMTDDHHAKDLWQMAYDELGENDQTTLAKLFPTTTTESQGAGRLRPKDILDQVVRTTEAQYKETQGNRSEIRATAHTILNSVLSFQDVISNVVKFDPTGHASSAWAIVSLGLTMAKNHENLRDALFDASSYLADLLARFAFIEEKFYRGRDPVRINVEKERSIIRVYVAILQYSAEVHRAQEFNKGKAILESITTVTSQQLTQLKSSIKEEEIHLHNWLLMDEHLRRKTEADEILIRIDELVMKIQKVNTTIAMLNLPFAPGAICDSFKDQHEDECLPGTRTELLQQIRDWGRSSGKCIFWLCGMAGTGKSTIARTVARAFKDDGILGASYFFKRGEGDQGSAAKFFPTIIKQLATHIPEIMPNIQEAIEKDSTILVRSLQEQFDKLMLQPLIAMSQDRAQTTVIVIDALDECEREEDVDIILKLLPEVERKTNIKIRFFLTSRPESPIRFGFDRIDQNDYQNTILQDLDGDIIKHDITIYLREEFSKIRQKKHQYNLHSEWPGEEKIQTLAMMAVPLFIFAATICRFVGDKQWNPEKRLQKFFTDSSGSKMDKTYRPILNQLLVEDESDTDQLVEEFQKIIGVIILLAAPLSLRSLAELLDISEDDISIRLDSFHSVLTIPNDPNLPIRILHLSFHDYLVDERTKANKSTSRFWVDKREKHEYIAGQCLILMGRCLRKNICKLPNYGTSRSDIDPASIAKFFPAALRYACHYWVYHLTQSSAQPRILDQVLPFLKEHFLHWLESMSILGKIFEAVNAIDMLLQLAKKIFINELSSFLLDARRFILKFVSIIDIAPLQVYSSGLIFAPQRSFVKAKFSRKAPNWLFKSPKLEENWSPELQTLEGHTGSVYSVAFSPDGQLLASGSWDDTIKLWDPSTGSLKHTLEGHSDSVKSVAFSPDGQLLASGSRDDTIKLWDPTTGSLKDTLEGHSSLVDSVAFSPDGQLLASGSGDHTIKLWDPTTGSLKHTLEGHSSLVDSVAFSPDGQLLASGSDDHTVKLWDPTTGSLKHTLEGHSDSVISVAFSPDGQLLASGSRDVTIKLWDPSTGSLKHTLEGHSFLVSSVAFSPDGQLLASGSWDDTIKLWDPTIGSFKHTLEGHSSLVDSVAFSPDGQLLASGSRDDTIKLWDPTTGSLKHTLEGHSDSVDSVAFSPDGQLLASGSDDHTVKLWDPSTGSLKHTLEGHSNSVISVAFSPDGQLLASGSHGGTIKLWDPTTGSLKHTLEGHSNSVISVAFSPDGQLLASGSNDQIIKLWDPTTGSLKHTLEGHSNSVISVAFSPDGQLLASGSHDHIIKLWDPTTGSLKHTLEGHSDSVYSVAFSPDGQLLASGSHGGTIKLWDPTTGSFKHTLNAKGFVSHIEFSMNLPLLITNRGSFNIQDWYKGFSLNPSEIRTGISLQEDHWIAFQGHRELWIPPEYRPLRSAIKDGIIAIGCQSGRVYTIVFSI